MIKIKIAAIIIFLLCSHFSIAQNYFEYYEGINKAKHSLIAGQLEKGVNHYFETFEKFDFIFARDCFNALEASSMLGDSNKIQYFLKRCLKQGVEFNLLEQNPILANFKKTDSWPEILLVKDSLRSIYENSINWEIRNEINTMFSEDQKIRDLADKNRFNVFRIKKLNKQFEEIDRKLVLRIIEITKEYGFPGEKLIGLDKENMHPKVNAHTLTSGMPIVILIHHYSQPNESYNSILIHQIKTGNLSNEHYAVISDFQNAYGKEIFGNIPPYSWRFNPKETVENININRAKIGLIDKKSTYALQQKKLITPFWINLK